MTSQLALSVELYEDADSDLERRRLEARVAGQYQVVRELGRGGMGVVFLARDVALHSTVAIKALRHEFVESEAHRERFRREARLTARLTHPGIVPVYTFGESKDLVYIVMQYVDGESLADRLARDGKVLWRHVGIASLTMRKLDPAFIGRHLARVGASALGSVGAYQIEGEGIQLFEKIEGDYFTIVGLPLLPVLDELRRLGAIDA